MCIAQKFHSCLTNVKKSPWWEYGMYASRVAPGRLQVSGRLAGERHPLLAVPVVSFVHRMAENCPVLLQCSNENGDADAAGAQVREQEQPAAV